MESQFFEEVEDVHGLHGRLKFKKMTTSSQQESWMDMDRKKLQAYEYLCHVQEAKEWIEAMIHESLPSIESLEESLRNGISFAKLAKAFDQNLVNRKIFDDATKLQFKHSDNINLLFQAMHDVGLPELFIFELTDLYDKKNIPKVIYCIHALSHLLVKKGLAPQLKNLLGQLVFTDEQLDKTHDDLEASGLPLPQFKNVQTTLAKELKEPTEEEKRQSFLLENEEKIKKLQQVWRACLQGKQERRRYQNRMDHWRSSQDAIIKIQSLWRAKLAQSAYQSLHSIKDANMKVLQKFLAVLDDTEFEDEEEFELEQLREQVIKKIRENIATETDVNSLDSKIALLVKNRITLEEVYHFTTKQMKTILSSVESLTDNSGQFNLKATDKENRQRKLYYEELFYLLQTEPHYLTKLMYLMNQKSGAAVTRFLEQTVLTLYGYAQNSREEYLLLNLIDSSIKLEISYLTKLEDFWRENPLFIKLVLQYIRGAKERLFLRELLQPFIKRVLKNKNLELELDAVTIYKKLIKQEESTTGEKSKRPYDITPQQAAQDADVKEIQLLNLEKLKEISSQFLDAIIHSSQKMPFGIRYIATRMKEYMQKKFPHQDQDINKIVGNLIYYRYINPAIVAPEAFDVIESTISSSQRKNLAEIAKTLHFISTERSIPSNEFVQLELNKFIQESSQKFVAFLNDVTTDVTAQEYFDMNEFMDSSQQSKPKIYISPDEIYQVHHNLTLYMDDLVIESNDSLKIILNDLGAVPPASFGNKQTGSEVILQLRNRFAKLDDADSKRIKKLFKETKRLVIAILHVQIGNNLLEALEAPVTQQEEQQFQQFVDSKPKFHSNESLGLDASTSFSTESLVDKYFNEKNRISFAQLKRKTLENMYKLEECGQVSKENKYQDMLNSLTEDILNKHRRRSRYQRELESLKKTLNSLQEKSAYLQEQKKSYHDYIHSCMNQLGKKGKHKRILPFTKQYYHIKQLQKQGKMPQFGSFKYSAAELQKKGVLISMQDYEPKQYHQIALTISSDEPGIFIIEVSFLGVKLPEKMELKLEDLLIRQDNHESFMMLFDTAKVNLNLLIFLLNKKSFFPF